MANTRAQPGALQETEYYWRDSQQWLESSGYILRSRYKPDWTPSWKGTKKPYYRCDDGLSNPHGHLLDATRVSDGAMVMLKQIMKSVHPLEAEIAGYLSSDSLARDPRNHCVPIYEVLPDPNNEDIVIMVMPLLRRYNDPRFWTVGEAVEFFRQLFEGLQFIHQHHVAHRDCMNLNIMMDPRAIFPKMYHPRFRNRNRTLTGAAKQRSRISAPTKYLYIDFGLSRRYSPEENNPLAVPILGGDRTVPEFQDDEFTPRNPFHTDIYYIGNLIREDFLDKYSNLEFMRPLVDAMVTKDPGARPKIDEVVVQFDEIRRGLKYWKLRSRLHVIKDDGLMNFVKDVAHFFWTAGYIIRLLPPVPALQ